MSERRSTTICAVAERPDHHCGDDLVQPVAIECLGAFINSTVDFVSILGSRLWLFLVVNPNQINSCFSASPSQFIVVVVCGSFGDAVVDAD